MAVSLVSMGRFVLFFLVQEIKLSDQLFGLYVDVLETLGEWKHVSPHALFGSIQYPFPQLIRTNILFTHVANTRLGCPEKSIADYFVA